MEKTEKYQKSKIYKIVDNGYQSCYYGSTTQSLCNRMSRHRQNYNSFKNGKFNKISVFNIFDDYGLENCKIELVENYPCNNKEELRKKEGEYIKNNDCVNKCVAGRTEKEWYNDNKESKINQVKKYRETHKNQISQNKKDYYQKNKEIISEKDKKYRENNLEKIKERNKKWREDNKEILSQKKKEYYQKKKSEKQE